MARAYVAISIVTVLWATNFTVGKIGTEQIDPYFIAASRIIVTGLFFYALLSPEERRIARSDWKAILPLSLTGIATNHVCFAWGIKQTTPSHSAIIHALVPVFVSIAAWFLIKEKLGPVAIGGMAIAVGGALIVVLGATRADFRGTIVGDLLSTVGIIAFSVYTVFGRRLLGTMGSFRAVTLAFLFAAPLMLPVLAYGIVRQPSWKAVTWEGWAALAYMLICANMICYSLHIFALSHLKAGQVAAFTDLQPAIGIAVAVLAGRDHLTMPLLAGAGLALVGVALVQLRR